ncbi:MAG: adenylosuccinate lyase [bacterium]|nr:adenylosuccinate lyase [bacterium]
MKPTTYESPLVSRYASVRMSELFGAQRRILTWRRLWLALARGQRELGLKISARAITELERGLERIDFTAAAGYERQFRHDVVAHIHAYADVAPAARAIIHQGATSAYVVDNADLVIMRDALILVRDWLANVIDALGRFAMKHRARPTLGFTHYQPAQLTTVGKRASLWCYDFVRDIEEIETRLGRLRFRGVKGTTGTQDTFLKLFKGDHDKVERLERLVAKSLGFAEVEPVTGQTYSRKVDAQAAAALAGVACSVSKFSGDVRLLANLKEIEEPFEKDQVGSSAMAYKRNPMRCERATSLARYVLSAEGAAHQTAAAQWLERTLDDSAAKRIVMPEVFLATDGMLRLVTNVARGMVVYPEVIRARIQAELPFMATEEIILEATAAGGDRQELHEAIRGHSHAAAEQVKQHGRANDLIDRLAADRRFVAVDLRRVLDAKRFIGRAPEQVAAFNREHVVPLRRRYRKSLNADAALSV